MHYESLASHRSIHPFCRVTSLDGINLRKKEHLEAAVWLAQTKKWHKNLTALSFYYVEREPYGRTGGEEMIPLLVFSRKRGKQIALNRAAVRCCQTNSLRLGYIFSTSTTKCRPALCDRTREHSLAHVLRKMLLPCV